MSHTTIMTNKVVAAIDRFVSRCLPLAIEGPHLHFNSICRKNTNWWQLAKVIPEVLSYSRESLKRERAQGVRAICGVHLLAYPSGQQKAQSSRGAERTRLFDRSVPPFLALITKHQTEEWHLLSRSNVPSMLRWTKGRYRLYVMRIPAIEDADDSGIRLYAI